MSGDTFLSQDEVDALLAATGAEPAAPQEALEPDLTGYEHYDLGSPDRIARRRIQTLELIHERFARHLRSNLLAFVHRNADTSVGPMRIQRYGDFERNLPVPSNLNVVSLKPLRGHALFAFDPTLIFLIIEGVFGGQAKYHSRVEGRDFTATEQRIIGRLLGETLANYAQAWAGILELHPTHDRSEVQAKFVNIARANEAVIVTPIRIDFGSVGGTLHICLPYSMIEPVRDQLNAPLRSGGEEEDDSGWSAALKTELAEVNLSLRTVFAEIDLKVGELMQLQAGSILPLQLPATVQVQAAGVSILECGYGVRHGHYALVVKRHLNLPADLQVPKENPADGNEETTD